MLMVGNGLGRWKTMPTRLRTSSARRTRAVDIELAEVHPTLDTAAQVVVEAVDGSQQSGLATPRGADERCDLASRHLQRDPAYGEMVFETDRDVLEAKRRRYRPSYRLRGQNGRIEEQWSSGSPGK